MRDSGLFGIWDLEFGTRGCSAASVAVGYIGTLCDLGMISMDASFVHSFIRFFIVDF